VPSASPSATASGDAGPAAAPLPSTPESLADLRAAYDQWQHTIKPQLEAHMAEHGAPQWEQFGAATGAQSTRYWRIRDCFAYLDTVTYARSGRRGSTAAPTALAVILEYARANSLSDARMVEVFRLAVLTDDSKQRVNASWRSWCATRGPWRSA
jgi:hypothetical protein